MRWTVIGQGRGAAFVRRSIVLLLHGASHLMLIMHTRRDGLLLLWPALIASELAHLLGRLWLS